jgi:hypothetical protein
MTCNVVVDPEGRDGVDPSCKQSRMERFAIEQEIEKPSLHLRLDL